MTAAGSAPGRGGDEAPDGAGGEAVDRAGGQARDRGPGGGSDPDGGETPGGRRAPLRIGVDIGGTFTDVVAVRPAGRGGAGARVRTLKLLSTPDDPSRAVLEGVRRVMEEAGDPPAPSGGGRAPAAEGADAGDAAGPGGHAAGRPGGGGGRGAGHEATGDDGPGPEVVHGTTVATNAVLERDGARTAFVATEGFGDLLRLARQDRPELYDLFADRPEPLVPPELCFEVAERVDAEGRVLQAPDVEEARGLAGELEDRGVESVALCFLFSYLRPEHEERVAGALREAGLRVSVSSEVLPEFREYERASTTAVDAYVGPSLDRYLVRLDERLPPSRFRVMQSSGGSVGVEAARRHAVRSVLSGPAGGVVGAVHAARRAGHRRVITLDMGGTSTDVSLAEGEPRVTTEARVGGLPVAVPVVDVNTVGSGGGSVARVDEGGALRVGPQSAGADPGPVCYGRGGRRPTVTDAQLVLGRLAPDRFLGGRMELDAEGAYRALEDLGHRAGLPDASGLGRARAAALGVVRVAGARMERALRVISVERGHDPADFTLVSFGGAGGLHACDLARALGVGTVLLPPGASTLSAFGMLAADAVRGHSRTVMLPGDVAASEIDRRFDPLVERAREELRGEGFASGRVDVRRELEMRYRGQSYEVRVPWDAGAGGAADAGDADAAPGAGGRGRGRVAAEAGGAVRGRGHLDRFHERHRRIYGHAEPGEPVEIVTLRVRGRGRVDPPELPEAEPSGADASHARSGRRPVVVGGAAGRPDPGGASVEEVPFYEAERLRPGHRIDGPAVVVREDTTLYLGRDDAARVDRHVNLVAEVGR